MQIFANGISLEVEDHGPPSGDPSCSSWAWACSWSAGTWTSSQPSCSVASASFAVVVMLSAVLVAAPIPLGNVIPAIVIALISLAYLEEDGLLLSIALLAAVIVLTVMLGRFGRPFSTRNGSSAFGS